MPHQERPAILPIRYRLHRPGADGVRSFVLDADSAAHAVALVDAFCRASGIDQSLPPCTWQMLAARASRLNEDRVVATHDLTDEAV